jgi:hypothetical protein
MVAVLAQVEWGIWQNAHLFSPNSATRKVEKHFLLAEVKNGSRKHPIRTWQLGLKERQKRTRDGLRQKTGARIHV